MSRRQSGSVSQRSTKKEEPEKEEKNEAKSGEVNKDALNKCSECGKKESTVHCVHCGMLVCKNCRGEHVRGIMGDLKKSKDYLENQYPKAVRERINIINKVQKDLEEKKKRALKAAAEGFRELKQKVDEHEKLVYKRIEKVYSDKRSDLENEAQIFQGHLEENKKQNEKVSANSCAMIHFPVGRMDDSQLALLCQTRKIYVDIIETIDKPEDRDEPLRTKLAFKYEDNRDDTFKAIDGYGEVVNDKEEGEKKKKSKSKRNSEAGQQEEEDDNEREQEVENEEQHN